MSFINLYLSRSNKKIHILLRRTTKNIRLKEEINFYKKIFQSNCVLHQIDDWKKKYKLLDKYENIIFTLSTMGYEAIARKKKVAIFTPNYFNGSKVHFGWPAPYNKRFKFFSTQKITYDEVRRILKNVNSCSQRDWNTKHYNLIKDQLYFDKNNKDFRNFILKLLKN